jgi:hypothetical protein
MSRIERVAWIDEAKTDHGTCTQLNRERDSPRTYPRREVLVVHPRTYTAMLNIHGSRDGVTVPMTCHIKPLENIVESVGELSTGLLGGALLFGSTHID